MTHLRSRAGNNKIILPHFVTFNSEKVLREWKLMLVGLGQGSSDPTSRPSKVNDTKHNVIDECTLI